MQPGDHSCHEFTLHHSYGHILLGRTRVNSDWPTNIYKHTHTHIYKYLISFNPLISGIQESFIPLVSSETEAQRAHFLQYLCLPTPYEYVRLSGRLYTSWDCFNLYILCDLINSQTLKLVTIVHFTIICI